MAAGDLNLAQLRDALTASLETVTNDGRRAKLLHSEAMAHILNIQKADGSTYINTELDAQLKNAVIRSLDIEWYESGPKTITELGIAEMDRPRGSVYRPIWQLGEMMVHHMRLKETAHMVNGKKVTGHPDMFMFGRTSFVDVSEAKKALTDIFVKKDSSGNLCPIILVGHAVDNDIDVLREKFGFDLAALGNVVMVLDTQVMAKEFGMGGKRLQSLKSILMQYAIEEPYLHNAGNDVGQTMAAAALLSYERVTGRGRYYQENHGDVIRLKNAACNRSMLKWGSLFFCTSCESTEHVAGACPNQYLCARCNAVPKYQDRAKTHPIERCVLPADPCKACMESGQVERQKEAMIHFVEDCPYEKKAKPAMHVVAPLVLGIGRTFTSGTTFFLSPFPEFWPESETFWGPYTILPHLVTDDACTYGGNYMY